MVQTDWPSHKPTLLSADEITWLEIQLRPRLDESSPTKNGKVFPLHPQNMSAITRTTESAVVHMPGQ